MIRIIVKLFILIQLFGSDVIGQTFKLNKQVRGFRQVSEEIYSIGQDKKGFVWLTTNKGTKYSDGIMDFELPDSVRIELLGPQKVWIDEEGLVWLYHTAGSPVVYHYDLVTWHRMDLSLPENLNAAHFKSISFFTVGTGEKKVLYHMFNGMVAQYSGPDNTPEFYRTEELGNFYSIFVEGSENTMFFFEKGVYTLNPHGFILLKHPVTDLGETIVKAVFCKDEGMYYFLTKGSVYTGKGFFEMEKLFYTGFSTQVYSSKDYFDLWVEKGQVYFFYNSQLFKYNSGTERGFEISAYQDLKVHHINAAMVDREGTKWIGTYRGLAVLPSLRFQNFNEFAGLTDPDISAAFTYGRNNYIVGYNGGIQLWDGIRSVKKIAFHSPKQEKQTLSRVFNFTEDKNGHLWFSAYQAGLGFFNTSTLDYFLMDLPENVPVNYIMTEGDSLWVAGANKIYGSILPRPGHRPQLSLIERDFGDGVELGFIRKIGKLKNGKWLILDNGNNNPDASVVVNDGAIIVKGYSYLEKNDTLFLGTDEGYFFLDEDKLRPVFFENTFINRPVYAILEATDGNLWLGTDDGVIRIVENRKRTFNENNGLIGNDVSRGALLEVGAGRVVIGTQNGVSVYIPEEDEDKSIAPLVNIEKLTVNSVDDHYETQKLLIPYAQNSIAITYSAVSFSTLPELVVQYRLEGFHNDWTQIRNPRNNQLYFNNLPPGTYRLALKASYSDQYESDVVYSPEFIIAKPFYLQLWFILMVIVFFIGVGMIINMLFLQFKNQDILKNTLDEKTSEIRHREDQFRNVWESSQDGLMLSMLGGKVVAANPALCAMAGIKEEELKERGLPYLFSDPGFYETLKPKVRQSTLGESKNGFSREMTIPFRKGECQVELRVTRMGTNYNGQPFFLNVFRDVSSKKAYEQGLKYAKEKAEEANKLKSSILSNMSHEIRTPLNGILGSTENIMQSRHSDEELIGQLEIIKESGERLLQTMNNILDLSKIESNGMNVEYEDTNIKDFISKILINHRSLAIKKGILVSVKFKTQPFIAKIDRKYLEIIINNIVDNAVKYTEKGLIQIVTEKKDDTLFFQVKDEGIGISEKYLERLFDPFEQESKGYDRKFEGAGIGLAITKHLVELLSGHIRIESEKDKGTVVTVTLPLEG